MNEWINENISKVLSIIVLSIIILAIMGRLYIDRRDLKVKHEVQTDIINKFDSICTGIDSLNKKLNHEKKD